MTSEDPDYWKQPVDCGSSDELWLDRYKNVQGMLSAHWIKYYVDTVTMISPFQLGNLKPAGYELTLGPSYYINGRYKWLTPKRPHLEIPPNSIVFVSMQERLILPHYIAARFNLSIQYIYQGLLLGTGPQVDPGFKGVLGCPLHNISNQSIGMKLGDAIAKIDFLKTTWGHNNPTKQLEAIEDERALYLQAQQSKSDAAPLFNASKLWREPIRGYVSNRGSVSSSIDSVNRELQTFRKYGFTAFIGAVVASVLTVAGVLYTGLGIFNDIKVGRESQNDSIRKLEVDSQTDRTAIQSIDARMSRIESILQQEVSQPAIPANVGLEGATEKADEQP